MTLLLIVIAWLTAGWTVAWLIGNASDLGVPGKSRMVSDRMPLRLMHLP